MHYHTPNSFGLDPANHPPGTLFIGFSCSVSRGTWKKKSTKEKRRCEILLSRSKKHYLGWGWGVGTRKNGKGTGKWLILLFAGTNSQACQGAERGFSTDYRHKIRFFLERLRSCKVCGVGGGYAVMGFGMYPYYFCTKVCDCTIHTMCVFVD